MITGLRYPGRRATQLASHRTTRPRHDQLEHDITYLDVEYLLEFLARVKLGDANRTAGLRQRHLAVIIGRLRSTQPTPLPGTPPTWQEQTERWITR
jgi:hypothetical protein